MGQDLLDIQYTLAGVLAKYCKDQNKQNEEEILGKYILISLSAYIF